MLPTTWDETSSASTIDMPDLMRLANTRTNRARLILITILEITGVYSTALCKIFLPPAVVRQYANPTAATIAPSNIRTPYLANISTKKITTLVINGSWTFKSLKVEVSFGKTNVNIRKPTIAKATMTMIG